MIVLDFETFSHADLPTVGAYRYDGDWGGIVTIPDYWLAHRRLFESPPVPNLYDP
mgnify:CR=1 FL=1